MLCTRRDIECIYRGGFRQPGRVSKRDDSEADANASVGEVNEHEDCNDESMPPTDSNTEAVSGGDLHERNVEFLKNITIVLPHSNTKNECPPLGHGMKGIYELLLA